MSKTLTLAAREEDRSEFSGQSDLKVIVHRCLPGGTCENFDAKPLDVSRKGVKIATSRPLQFEEMVELTFQSCELDVDFTIAATVRWMRPASDDESMMVGCLFSTELPNGLLMEFAET